ncbi:MAG: hypothetical protein METHAR1v1_680002 [Methanothrix sp.]|nr:MAG: hypothetical protein METHAR1v1_680002 [Methanothrix sp.]
MVTERGRAIEVIFKYHQIEI